MTLLLDALNEIPLAEDSEFRERVQLWKDWLVRLASEHPGNRVVFSCRSLDYSQSLSTPDLRVPQVRIEPLDDEQVRAFLAVYSPGRWREIWWALEGSPQLEVLRSPYFLALLVEQVEATGELPAGRAALFTGFVRQALRREVERGSPLFEPGELLDSRDLRRIAKWQWKGPHDLPDRGRLLPKLSGLAHAMQQAREDAGGSQVRVDFDDALDLLDDPADEAIVQAGEALSVLDEDEAAGELMYIHQLVQEYFAARELARRPDPELLRLPWRAAEISPSVDEVVDTLAPADPLPPLAGTGWDETTILAAAMTKDPARFLRGLMGTNLALAGRAAAQPELLSHLPADLLNELRWALVRRSRDPEADLRDRIACGYEDEGWWVTPDAKRWRRGELADEGTRWNIRYWRRRFLADPDLLEQAIDDGRIASAEVAERWRGWLTLDEDAFEAMLDARVRGKRLTEPAYWHDARLNHPVQPVVGVSWYEAIAYCSWLAAQTGLDVRLPTEVEREAAAGGKEGRRYPWGEGEERMRANTIGSRLKRSTPVGVLVEGDSPEQVADLGGNAFEWTTSLFGRVHDEGYDITDYPYPYASDDGREDLGAGDDLRRVVRGGGWATLLEHARSAARLSELPSPRYYAYGFRVVVSAGPATT